MSKAGTLVLLRHGESTANAAQRFTGLLDVDLTYLGAQQARAAAGLMERSGAHPDVVLTSPLQRARRTAELVIAELGLVDVPLLSNWRLEERDYGILTGLAKGQVWERYGPERLFEWRRTLHGKPPAAGPEQVAGWDVVSPVTPDSPAPGSSESLQDVIDRVRPCWEGEIRRMLHDGRCILVVAHGNSLRALCAVIDSLNERELERLNIAPGQALEYDPTPDGRLSPRGGRYLDAAAASADAVLIAAEGGT